MPITRFGFTCVKRIKPGAIRDRLTGLQEILGKKISEANRIMRKLFPEKIKMAPVRVEGRKGYRATGVLSLYAAVKFDIVVNGVPNEIRTRVLTVKG